MSTAMVVSPTPSPEEAAAIAAAVRVLLESSRHAADADPRPAAYRSAWRRAAILQGVERAPDPMRSP